LLPGDADQTQPRLAADQSGITALGVPATRMHEIVKERRAITADTAARLARHFGSDATSWRILQADYDLKTLPNLREIERVVQRA